MPAHIGTTASDAVRLAELARQAYEEGLSPHGGFLPPEIPLTSLPGPLARYVDICRELPRHYHGPDAHVRPWLDEQLRGGGADEIEQAGADRAAVSSADDGPGVAGTRLPLGLVAAAPGGAPADQPGASRPAGRPVVACVAQTRCPLRREPVPLRAVELATAISAGRRPLRQRRAGGREPRARVSLSVPPEDREERTLFVSIVQSEARGAEALRAIVALLSAAARGCAPDHVSARTAPDRHRRRIARVRDRDPQAASKAGHVSDAHPADPRLGAARAAAAQLAGDRCDGIERVFGHAPARRSKRIADADRAGDGHSRAATPLADRAADPQGPRVPVAESTGAFWASSTMRRRSCGASSSERHRPPLDKQELFNERVQGVQRWRKMHRKRGALHLRGETSRGGKPIRQRGRHGARRGGRRPCPPFRGGDAAAARRDRGRLGRRGRAAAPHGRGGVHVSHARRPDGAGRGSRVARVRGGRDRSGGGDATARAVHHSSRERFASRLAARQRKFSPIWRKASCSGRCRSSRMRPRQPT